MLGSLLSGKAQTANAKNSVAGEKGGGFGQNREAALCLSVVAYGSVEAHRCSSFSLLLCDVFF